MKNLFFVVTVLCVVSLLSSCESEESKAKKEINIMVSEMIRTSDSLQSVVFTEACKKAGERQRQWQKNRTQLGFPQKVSYSLQKKTWTVSLKKDDESTLSAVVDRSTATKIRNDKTIKAIMVKGTTVTLLR